MPTITILTIGEFDFIKEWGMIAGIAGIGLGIFIYLFRSFIQQKIFPMLTKKQAFTLLTIFLIMVWLLSLVCIGVYIYQEQNGKGMVTILVHGDRKDQLVLPGKGRVKLIYGQASVVQTTNDQGEATFKEIPSSFFDPEARVEILFFDPDNEPYRTVKPDSLYKLNRNKSISLIVRQYGLGQLKGIVTNFMTGQPLDSVKVSILGCHSFSNADGEYILNIPDTLQQKFQTVRASRKNFKQFVQHQVAIIPNSQLPIPMEPQN